MRRLCACIGGVVTACVGIAVAAVVIAAVSPPAPGGGVGGLLLFLLVGAVAAYLLFALAYTLLRRGCFRRGGCSGKDRGEVSA